MGGWLLFGIFLGLLALLILPFVFWILKVVKLSKNEDKTGMWVVLACGFFMTPLVGWLVGFAFKEDDGQKNEENKYFWCSLCYIKYKEEFLGGETAREGKICRFCLEKKQKGEGFKPSEERGEEVNQKPPQPEKTSWDYQKPSEKKRWRTESTTTKIKS